MNYRNLALAAFLAWIVDGLYGYIVYGKLLLSQFERFPGVFRPFDEVNANMPLMAAGGLIAMFALAFIFAKGHEGGNGIQEGLRFGVVVAVLMVAGNVVTEYCVMNFGRRLAAELAVAVFVETAMVGLILGAVYRPVLKARTMAL